MATILLYISATLQEAEYEEIEVIPRYSMWSWRLWPECVTNVAPGIDPPTGPDPDPDPDPNPAPEPDPEPVPPPAPNPGPDPGFPIDPFPRPVPVRVTTTLQFQFNREIG